MIRDTRKKNEFYQALLNRDSQFNGVFYAGVTTTNIFCLAECRARKPKPENVVFFETVQEALRHGFRPCKVCRPTEHAGTPPEDVRHLISLANRSPESRITDEDIRKLGFQPSRVRRWFKSHHGITFQAYHRMLRLNTAYEQLRDGDPVTASAFDAGYESLSGFGYSFRNAFSENPSAAEKVRIMYLDRFPTPLGPMYAGATDSGLCLLEFTDRRMLESEFRDLSGRLKCRIAQGRNTHINEVRKQIMEYFQGERMEFSLTLETPGTAFQQAVWNQLKTIPYGATRTYKEQAARINKPAAVRAVARANGMNRIAIVIPCHRVIGVNGELTGYAGGLARKRWLIDHECRLTGHGQMKFFD